MAPSYAQADLAYRNAANALSATCTGLEYYLPDDTTQAHAVVRIPPTRPRAVSVTCAQCVEELEALNAGSRDGHQCTHQRDDETGDETIQPRDGVQSDAPRRRQPNAGVIRQM